MKTRDIILVALFAALTSIGAYINIPIPYVPITLQLFFCIFAGIILGAKLGMLSQIVYLIIGLCGIPVFAGGAGGPSYIFTPSFGYILGFIAAAYVIGKLVEDLKYEEISFIRLFLIETIGVFVIYVFGVIYLYIIMNFYMGKATTAFMAIKYGFIPFIIGDLIKCAAAAVAGRKIIKILRSNV